LRLRLRVAVLHLLAVEGPHLRVLKQALTGAGEVVRRHVDRVRPDTELRVVGERAAALRLPGVEVPAAADGIAGLRDGEALVEGAAGEVRPGEVGDDEAVADRIVESDGIASVGGVARRPGAVEEVVEGGSRELVARLVEDPDRG